MPTKFIVDKLCDATVDRNGWSFMQLQLPVQRGTTTHTVYNYYNLANYIRSSNDLLWWWWLLTRLFDSVLGGVLSCSSSLHSAGTTICVSVCRQLYYLLHYIYLIYGSLVHCTCCTQQQCARLVSIHFYVCCQCFEMSSVLTDDDHCHLLCMDIVYDIVRVQTTDIHIYRAQLTRTMVTKCMDSISVFNAHCSCSCLWLRRTTRSDISSWKKKSTLYNDMMRRREKVLFFLLI